MKLKYKTKLQQVSGSLTTTVPVFVRDLLELEKGDSVEWEIDTKDETILLKKA